MVLRENWIEITAGQGIAPRYPPEALARSLPEGQFFEAFQSVMGTAGVKPASTGQERGNAYAVKLNKRPGDAPCYARSRMPALMRSLRNSSVPASGGIFIQADPGNSAMCQPGGMVSISGSRDTLHFRRIRLRMVARPSLRGTQKATFAAPSRFPRYRRAVFFP